MQGLDPGSDGANIDALGRLATQASCAELAAQAKALADRVRDGLLYVTCLGQFKRGKSSLINALLGTTILPVGVAPVTALVTIVRQGPRKLARIRRHSGQIEEIPLSELVHFVSEEQNPQNIKGVAAVEVFLPCELLSHGLCLVDTPGVGSVFQNNTDATRAFVPHVDAALVVLGAAPPISADELTLVEEISGHCDTLIFVMNKADQLNAAELAEAGAFTRRVLAQRIGITDVPLLEVSAAEQLAGQDSSRDWSALTQALTSLSANSRSELLLAAESRGVALLVERLRHHLRTQRRALLDPLDASQRRLEALRSCVAQAERSLAEIDYRFAAEDARLREVFAQRSRTFLERIRPVASTELHEAIRRYADQAPPDLRKELRRKAIELARQICTRHIDAWLARLEPEAHALYATAMNRFVEISNGFLAQLSGSGEEDLAQLPSSVDPQSGLQWDSRLYFNKMVQFAGDGAINWVFDRLATRKAVLRSVESTTAAYLARLLESNAVGVENDLNLRVLESRRRFRSELQGMIHELVRSAAQALERSRQAHAQGSAAVQAELARIDEQMAQLSAMAAPSRALSPALSPHPAASASQAGS